MNKEFITYEQALALKGIEFDEPCFGYYKDKKLSGVNKWDRKDWEFHILKNKDITNLTSEIILAPLYQQAFRWFREKYGLFAEITLWGDGLGYISMIKEIKQEEFIEVYQKAIIDAGLPIWKYEEAELKCLKKLIEIVKEKNE